MSAGLVTPRKDVAVARCSLCTVVVPNGGDVNPHLNDECILYMHVCVERS